MNVVGYKESRRKVVVILEDLFYLNVVGYKVNISILVNP
ncbi:hypothetical protein B4135_2070 [Caldibacillus debilis]|uniref:Uncharacterized protein n=1 Tax=Caldibacillus debilis TaxID=301148 RepID=A0A150M5G1_9BACI|nr:hypothetical protein B4135_2070 [Caldibacillus debilis]